MWSLRLLRGNASSFARVVVQGERQSVRSSRLTCGFAHKTSQIGGFAGGQHTLSMLDELRFAIVRKMNGASPRAEQIRLIRPRRSAGTISRRRFPRDLARNLCALRDYGCADSAG